MKAFILSIALMAFGHIQSVSAETRPDYFPDGVWGHPPEDSRINKERADQVYETWFGGQLTVMKERPLWIERKKAGAILSVRLSIHTSAFPPSWAVRISLMADGSMTVVVKVQDFCPINNRAHCKGNPSVMVRQAEASVDQAKARRIMNLVARIDPFTSKTPSQGEEDGLDGTTTVFEFSEDGRFNAMQRWELSDQHGGALGQLQKELIGIGRDAAQQSK